MEQAMWEGSVLYLFCVIVVMIGGKRQWVDCKDMGAQANSQEVFDSYRVYW